MINFELTGTKEIRTLQKVLGILSIITALLMLPVNYDFISSISAVLFAVYMLALNGKTRIPVFKCVLILHIIYLMYVLIVSFKFINEVSKNSEYINPDMWAFYLISIITCTVLDIIAVFISMVLSFNKNISKKYIKIVMGISLGLTAVSTACYTYMILKILRILSCVNIFGSLVMLIVAAVLLFGIIINRFAHLVYWLLIFFYVLLHPSNYEAYDKYKNNLQIQNIESSFKNKAVSANTSLSKG